MNIIRLAGSGFFVIQKITRKKTPNVFFLPLVASLLNLDFVAVAGLCVLRFGLPRSMCSGRLHARAVRLVY